jgi:hypothetical protein
MKYSIRVNSSNGILAVNKWKPKTQRSADGRYELIYDIPDDVEMISEEQYNDLLNNTQLSFITWVDGKQVPEPIENTEQRQIQREARREQSKINELKALLIKLEGLVVFTNEGKNLIK